MPFDISEQRIHNEEFKDETTIWNCMEKKSYVCEYMDEAVVQGSIAFKETLKRTQTYTPL